MRDKDGWDLTQKQRKRYLESFKLLCSTQGKDPVGIVPPRVNLEDLKLCTILSHPEIPDNSKASGSEQNKSTTYSRQIQDNVSRGTIAKNYTNVSRETLKPKTRKEWREQEEIYKWTQKHPLLGGHVMMIGNEGRRTVVQAAVAKRMGLLPGSSDLFIARPVMPYAGLWLEVKQNRSYSTSERKKDSWLRQEGFQARMRSAGYAACFCFGAEDGIKKIMTYLEKKNDQTRVEMLQEGIIRCSHE